MKKGNKLRQGQTLHCCADFRRTCGQKELQLPLLGFRLFLLDGVDGRCEQIIGMRVELISTLWLGFSFYILMHF